MARGSCNSGRAVLAPLCAQITEIEHHVNTEIIANAATTARLMDMDSAKTTGAMMLFGEKYSDTVRVLNIGESVELCGGVHVNHTGDIGLFKITSESGVAAGVRRIEAVTGHHALAYVQQQTAILKAVATGLDTSYDSVIDKVTVLQETLKNTEKELSVAKAKLATYAGADLVNQVQLVNGINVLAATLNGADAQALRETVIHLKAKLGSTIIVLASVLADDKLQLIAGVVERNDCTEVSDFFFAEATTNLLSLLLPNRSCWFHPDCCCCCIGND